MWMSLAALASPMACSFSGDHGLFCSTSFWPLSILSLFLLRTSPNLPSCAAAGAAPASTSVAIARYELNLRMLSPSTRPRGRVQLAFDDEGLDFGIGNHVRRKLKRLVGISAARS